MGIAGTSYLRGRWIVTIRGIPPSRRWSPRAAAPGTDTEVRGVVRALVTALGEVRDGQVLAGRHQKRLRCAIDDLQSIVDDHEAHVSAEGGRGRRTAAAVRQDLAVMKRDAVRPSRPTTSSDLAWSLLRLREAGR